MTQHPPLQLQDRHSDELVWFKRRSLLQAAGGWLAAGGFVAAHAQERSNMVDLRGDVLRNGQRLRPGEVLSASERLETGPGSTVVFAVGNSAFMVRPNSRVALEGDTPTSVKVLRVLSGAVASVWGPGSQRQITLPTATAGIRGTGVYAEVFADQGDRGYFCNCYGTVEVSTRGENVLSQASYHQAYWVESEPRNGRLLTPAGAVNHTDEELEFLAFLVQQRTAWDISGVKGIKDGSGKTQPPYGPPGS